jgi:hypothetical protein
MKEEEMRQVQLQCAVAEYRTRKGVDPEAYLAGWLSYDHGDDLLERLKTFNIANRSPGAQRSFEEGFHAAAEAR